MKSRHDLHPHSSGQSNSHNGGATSERSAGHDVVWAGEWHEDPGDEEILERAHVEGRILVTLDKDFGELAIVYHSKVEPFSRR
jgi:hypothetical protein